MLAFLTFERKRVIHSLTSLISFLLVGVGFTQDFKALVSLGDVVAVVALEAVEIALV